MQGCVPSENRNRLSSSHWCNGRATFVHGEQEANALHVLAPHMVHRCPLEGFCGHVTFMSRYTATGAPRAGIAPHPPARARKALSDSLGLRIGRMHASSTCGRLRWLVSGPLLAAAERLGRWAYSDEPGCLGQRHSILASEDGLPSRLVDVTPTANRRQLPLAPSLRATLPRCGAAIRPPPPSAAYSTHAVWPPGADFHSLGLHLPFDPFSCIIDLPCSHTLTKSARFCSTSNQLATLMGND